MKNLLKDKKIKLLKEYFEKAPEVLMAFVFGSYAKGMAGEESDFDVAVYLKDKERGNKIWLEVSDIVQDREVDLVPLQEAPATLVSYIFKTGLPLVIKDKKLYWNLYLKKSSEAEDFVRFAEDFWRIYERARSLIPEERGRLLERRQFLDSELQEIDEMKKLSFEEYSQDKMKRRNIDRWVELICNATIDIAKLVLASEKRRMPRSYEQVLLAFGAFLGFSKEEAEKLAEFAELRNILAHEYLEVLYDRIQNFLKDAPEFYKKILTFLENYLETSGS